MRVDGNQAQALEVVDAVVAVARALLQPGTTRTNADAQTRSAGAERHVVAQYNAQVGALKRAPSDVDVARLGTVDKFQGKEVPVVIYSCTSSSPEDAPLGMAFLCDPHRFNVATSRARSTVIVVASPQLFEPDCRTRSRWSGRTSKVARDGIVRCRHVNSNDCAVQSGTGSRAGTGCP